MTSGTRGKWSAVGTIVSAAVRGYYYPGRVHAIKRSVDGTSPALYSIIFANPLGSMDPPETGDQGLILDFNQSEIIGRGFESMNKALLSENQKVFVTFKGREVSARVQKHANDDSVSIVLDGLEPVSMVTKLHELRLLPSRKSGRVQEHPDYSLLANGRRSPTDMDIANASSSTSITSTSNINTSHQNQNNNSHHQHPHHPHHHVPASAPMRIQKTGRRRTTSSSLLETGKELPASIPFARSSHIDVPSGPGPRKRRPSQNQAAQMDECTAALVLMSLSASPRSSTNPKERLSLFRCTWPGCSHETVSCSEIEKHVREDHLRRDDNGDTAMDEEEFYYTEVDIRDKTRARHPSFPQMGAISSSLPTATINIGNSLLQQQHSSSGPGSPLSLSEDAASTSSSGVMTMGDNSMDSSPPASPMDLHNYSRSSGASSIASSSAIPVPASRYGLEDHDYNRKPETMGASLLSSSAGSARGSFAKGARAPTAMGAGGKIHHGISLLPSSPATTKTRPINIPRDSTSGSGSSVPTEMSSSFGGFGSHNSMASSGFGSFQSFGTGSPLSPVKLSSSLTNSSKYLKIGTPRPVGGAVHLVQQVNRTSPTKRVRGETRKCRKVFGMEKKDAWCTQCKWKKACTRFQD